MGKFQNYKATNRILSDGKEISTHQNEEIDVLWLLASQPNKALSSDDILDAIMASGIMIHEKQFVEMMAQNICRKTGVQLIQKNKNESYGYKNKFMNNDFDYL